MRQGPAGEAGTVTYLHSDHGYPTDSLGSTSLTTDAGGGFKARVLYYPYGEERYVEGTLTTDYQYTGQRYEAGFGLYDYGARYYDPALARFVSADTIVPEPGNPQGLNRYAYAYNNPLKYIDPSGHSSYPPGCENSQQCMDWWDANHPGDEPLPWYTPAVVGAAQIWWHLDSTFGELGRDIEADRLAMECRLQGGWKGGGRGFELVAETPFWTFTGNFGVSVRIDSGDSDGWRFDTAGGTTIRMPGVSGIEGYASGDLTEFGLKGKTPSRTVLDLGFGEVKAKDKNGLGVKFHKPLNATVVEQLSREYQLSVSNVYPMVKIEPYARMETTAHGGPMSLVAAPVLVHYGAPYVLGALGGLGTTTVVEQGLQPRY
jgi:RHS repeat-associated protein